jgi:hypothetical protein
MTLHKTGEKGIMKPISRKEHKSALFHSRIVERAETLVFVLTPQNMS